MKYQAPDKPHNQVRAICAQSKGSVVDCPFCGERNTIVFASIRHCEHLAETDIINNVLYFGLK